MFGLSWFEKWWIIREQRPWNPDAIVSIGYGSLQGVLANASVESILRAIACAEFFPSAVIAYANSSHCFLGSETFESIEKRRLFSECAIAATRLVDAGPIVNSVTEAEAIKRALRAKGIVPKEILLIADRFHGRSILWIWKRIFPGTRIALQYVSCPAYQLDALFPLQQSELRWLFANVARQIILRVFGLEAVRKVQHKHKN